MGESGFEPGSDSKKPASTNPVSLPPSTFWLALESTGYRVSPGNESSRLSGGGYGAPDMDLSNSVKDKRVNVLLH